MCIIRIGSVSDRHVFNVNSLSEFQSAVYQVLAESGPVEAPMACYLRCPDGFPQRWTQVVGVLIGQFWGGGGLMLDQWQRITECEERVWDLDWAREYKAITSQLGARSDGEGRGSERVIPFDIVK